MGPVRYTANWDIVKSLRDFYEWDDIFFQLNFWCFNSHMCARSDTYFYYGCRTNDLKNSFKKRLPHL